MNDNQVTDTAVPMKDDASMLGSVAADFKDAAAEKFGAAMTEVRAKADGAKDGVADEVKDVAMALRHASEELRGGSAQERTLGSIATSLADASDALRDKDLGEIVQMVSKVARNNPALFLGGAALLGFAASRYAKASSSHNGGTHSGGTQGGGMPTKAEQKERVEVFVDEGNPNTQPFHAPT